MITKAKEFVSRHRTAVTVGVLALVTPAASFADELPVATSTLKTFLGTIFGQGVNTMLDILTTIFPYMLVLAIIYLFWRIGKRTTHL